MTKAKVAQKSPYKVAVQEGKKYAWCACGLSANQPFCDGTHKITEIRPVIYTASKSGDLYFCGCKQTGGAPLCDGTHNTL
ncbi:CDGSH iron-sulfur domain-containing protein [Sneathiella sp. CAU 1612]|jgi:CDGSH iron-sulfur domain-containing protein 3|uniref:CDGSH iron-sulfur domain-containing protein n=1 Tax=Sneathiella sedimenti TaxID=2816034 RepID=A0ABS3F1A2_9PROT|nr:CDGSH iron-sulfur domain-containing protein [Sneathiella sedimenti]